MDLEEVDEETSRRRVRYQPRRKKFTAELDLLCSPPVREREKDGSSNEKIDVRIVPATVEITGLIFARDETSVQIDLFAPGILEGIDRAAEAVEQATPVGVVPKLRTLQPTRPGGCLGEASRLSSEQAAQHNNNAVLPCLSSPLVRRSDPS